MFPPLALLMPDVGELVLTLPAVYRCGFSAAIKSGMDAFDKWLIALEDQLG
jgi:hypothetical protein